MQHELAVWLFANQVGKLTLAQGRMQFSYAPSWLAHAQAAPLSGSLPLQESAFEDAACRAYFAGLLPEGQMRRVLAKQMQISLHNDFSLLHRIGGECAGAVTFLEPGQTPQTTTDDEAVRWLDDDALIALLDELPRRPMLAGQDGLRLSLAGAQDKLPVVLQGERIGLPLNNTPSSHILKPPIEAVDGSVFNEAFCLTLAQAMQLQTAACMVRTVRERSFLLVERYDRQVDKTSRLQRIHQEDFCQALSIVPELKYQNEGGPDLAACFALVRRMTRPNAPQVLRLLDACIFNALIGNHDAHAKNFSLLYSEATPILAPLYDLLCTAIYPTLTPKMAMKIGSKYKFSEVQARHWMQFADGAGLSKAQTRKRVMEMATRLPQVARNLWQAPNKPWHQDALVGRIVGLIEQRCAITQQRLSATDNNDLVSD
jgi:serine/threonine-protein kinase HipA